MATRFTMNVSLTPQLQDFVEAKVKSGRYQSSSEVIRESLRLMEKRDQTHAATLADVRRKVAVGIDQARRGELRDGEEVFDRVRDQLAGRNRRKAS